MAEAGFDADGLRRRPGRRQRRGRAGRGRRVLEAARVTPDDVAAALGGLVPAKRHAAELAADALHRALGAAARDGAPVLAPQLTAHAGGDERRRGQRRRRPAGARRRRRGGRRDARAVVRPGHRRRAQLLLAAGGDRRARRWPTGWASRTSRSTCASASGPRWWTDFLDGYAAGRTPNPCVRCNGHVRFDAHAGPGRRARARRAWPPATTPASPATRDGPLVRAAADPAQGPELHARPARARRSSSGSPFRSAG